MASSGWCRLLLHGNKPAIAVRQNGGEEALVPANRQGVQPEAKTQGEPVRCLCNKLISIRYDNVIEIKCNKCKRMVTIHTHGIDRIEIR